MSGLQQFCVYLLPISSKAEDLASGLDFSRADESKVPRPPKCLSCFSGSISASLRWRLRQSQSPLGNGLSMPSFATCQQLGHVQQEPAIFGVHSREGHAQC